MYGQGRSKLAWKGANVSSTLKRSQCMDGDASDVQALSVIWGKLPLWYHPIVVVLAARQRAAAAGGQVVGMQGAIACYTPHRPSVIAPAREYRRSTPQTASTSHRNIALLRACFQFAPQQSRAECCVSAARCVRQCAGITSLFERDFKRFVPT